jgi:hypothetical protein
MWARTIAQWLAAFVLTGFLADSAAVGQSSGPGLAPFLGTFVGRGIATDGETSLGDPLTVRDLDVIIRQAGNGFVLTWATVISHRRADGPRLQRRISTYAFQPVPRRSNWFAATESGDPLDGSPLIWAQVDGDTLQVTVFTVFDDGHSDLQIYSRRIVGSRMELTYTRSHENQRVATVRGWLSRTGD